MLKLLDAGKLPTAVPYPIQAWHFGDTTLVALGGETCVEYALRLKKELGPTGRGSSATRTRSRATSRRRRCWPRAATSRAGIRRTAGDRGRLDDVLRMAGAVRAGDRGADHLRRDRAGQE
jgi:hypothetical protein